VQVMPVNAMTCNRFDDILFKHRNQFSRSIGQHDTPASSRACANEYG
jgi:hypothetical protein